MKKRIVCMLLALTMILGLFAACGDKTSQSAASVSSASTEAGSEKTEAPTEAVSAVVGSAEEASDSALEDESEEFEEVAYDLPLTDEPVTYTMFTSSNTSDTGLEVKDNLVIKELQKRTGITLDITEVNAWSYTEQFALMVAGGDWTDILTNVRTSYNGGLASALNEEIIMDLSAYVHGHEPQPDDRDRNLCGNWHAEMAGGSDRGAY